MLSMAATKDALLKTLKAVGEVDFTTNIERYDIQKAYLKKDITGFEVINNNDGIISIKILFRNPAGLLSSKTTEEADTARHRSIVKSVINQFNYCVQEIVDPKRVIALCTVQTYSKPHIKAILEAFSTDLSNEVIEELIAKIVVIKNPKVSTASENQFYNDLKLKEGLEKKCDALIAQALLIDKENADPNSTALYLLGVALQKNNFLELAKKVFKMIPTDKSCCRELYWGIQYNIGSINAALSYNLTSASATAKYLFLNASAVNNQATVLAEKARIDQQPAAAAAKTTTSLPINQSEHLLLIQEALIYLVRTGIFYKHALSIDKANLLLNRYLKRTIAATAYQQLASALEKSQLDPLDNDKAAKLLTNVLQELFKKENLREEEQAPALRVGNNRSPSIASTPSPTLGSPHSPPTDTVRLASKSVIDIIGSPDMRARSASEAPANTPRTMAVPASALLKKASAPLPPTPSTPPPNSGIFLSNSPLAKGASTPPTVGMTKLVLPPPGRAKSKSTAAAGAGGGANPQTPALVIFTSSPKPPSTPHPAAGNSANNHAKRVTVNL